MPAQHRACPPILLLVLLACVVQPLFAQGGAVGVTLYRDANFSGRSATFTGDVHSLVNTQVGNDSVSSIRVPRGCQVTVYSDDNYRGRAETFDRDVTDLGRSNVGNDSITSLRVRCTGYGGPGYGGGSNYGDGYGNQQRRGVTLFTGADYSGDYEVFDRDDPGLYDNRIGDNRPRSVQVQPGCRVTLYDFPDYGGRSITLDSDNRDLLATRFGRAGVSSLRVECRTTTGTYPSYGQNNPPGGGYQQQRRGVTLFRDDNYGGRSEKFYADRADLGRSSIGNDSVSSVQVDPGCTAILYRDDDYRGAATEIRFNQPSLKGTSVGNDGASSLVVDCRGRRR